VDDVIQAVANGEIVEDYPDDKYRPSCLIYGRNNAGIHLHVQCSYAMPDVVIITAYEPSTSEWVGYKMRKKT